MRWFRFIVLTAIVFIIGSTHTAAIAASDGNSGSGAATSGETTQLKDLVVTANRGRTLLSNTPEIFQIISADEIAELNPSTTGELLEYVTGADVKTGTGSGLPNRSVIGLNGMPPKYTLVLVDGVRLLGEHHHTGTNIERIPPQSIERIEVMRGAAAAQYGTDTIGGVVNIVTKKGGDEEKGMVGASAGSYDTYTGDLAWFKPLSDQLKLSVFFNREQSQGRKIEAPDHRIDNMGYEENNLLARLEYDISRHSRLYTWLNRSGLTMDWLGGEEDGYLLTSASGWEQRLSPALDMHTRFSYSVWDFDVANEHHELWQPEAWLNWNPNDYHLITAGVDYKYREFERSSVENAPSQYTFGSFLKDDWILSEKLTLSSAVRFDDVEDIESVVSPKVSMLYSPELPARFRASVSRGFHAPTPQELHEVAAGHGGPHLRFGNADLDPEYSTNYGLGIELFPGDRFEVMLYNYYSRIDDMIVPLFEGPWSEDPEKNVWRRHNVDSVDLYGSEIELRYAFSKNFRIEGGYAYTTQSGTKDDQQLPYDPGSSAHIKGVANQDISSKLKCTGFIGMKAEFDRSAWNWKPQTEGPNTDLDDYQNLTAGVSFDYDNTYEAFLNGYNLLGQEIEALDDVLTRFAGEPSFQLGVRYRW